MEANPLQRSGTRRNDCYLGAPTFSLGDMIFESCGSATIGFLCIALLPPILTQKIWEEKLNVRLSLYHLVPTSFGTFVFPVFGATFGGPSLDEYS